MLKAGAKAFVEKSNVEKELLHVIDQVLGDTDSGQLEKKPGSYLWLSIACLYTLIKSSTVRSISKHR